jgi:probable HAF family extracellular repeat protein
VTLKLLTVILGTTALALTTRSAHGQCQYELTVVEHYCHPDETSPTIPTAINDHGDVCGFVTICTVGDNMPFVWTEASGLQLLPVPPGTESGQAHGIHEDGRIVGEINIPGPSAARAFVYAAGEWTLLDPVFPDGPARSAATAIGADGTVVGYRGISETDSSVYNAFMWHTSDGFTDLGVMDGPRSVATATSQGRVVGWTGVAAGGNNAFLHQAGKTVVLDVIPGGTRSAATAVNSTGILCGYGRLTVPGAPAGRSRAFVSDGASLTVLHPIGDHEKSAASAVTRQGCVLGRSWSGGVYGVATVWRHGEAVDINTLVTDGAAFAIHDAVAVNARGQIAAAAVGPNGVVAVRLDPMRNSPADLDGDCRADHRDMIRLFGDWGLEESVADINADGTVDALDFLLLLAHWG